MKKYKIICLLVYAGLTLAFPGQAMEPGTILYRTSGEGKMYGFSSKELIRQKAGVITNIYSGHAGIYIGKEDGVDYVVEALGSGIVKMPAKYFVNEAEGEQLVAARLPKYASPWQRAKAVAIAKYLALADLAYDFDFSAQKGPWSGDWTCVGLTEKVYESANADNPQRLGSLEYDQRYYAVNITPDGYDKSSIYNEDGDVFSRAYEYSKISRRLTTIFPAPEILGYNAGKEVEGQRYLFIPYTQALQSTLRDEPVDIDLSTPFPDKAVRGKVNNVGVILKWSLINNPLSGLRDLSDSIAEAWNTIFPEKDMANRLVWDEGDDSPTLLAGQTTLADKKITAPLVADINPALTTPAPSAAVSSAQVTTVIGTPNRAEEESHPIASPVASADIFAAARPTVSSPAATSTSTTKTAAATTKTTTKSDNNNVALWTPIASKLTSSTPTTTAATTSPVLNDDEDDTPVLSLVISRLHTQGDDDWLEIWNYGEEDIDLAANKIRLEKAKTAADPGIMLRFDAATDATFPGGTIIRAGEGYRIVRDDAALELRNAAHAIAIRSDFTLTDSGYTVYLAKGAVSSPEDEDILDYVGYGEAKYYEGSGPAPKLLEGYLLRRKADAGTVLSEILKNGSKENWAPKYDNDNNAGDWLLWPLGGILPTAPNDDDDDNPNNDDPPGDDEEPGDNEDEDEQPGGNTPGDDDTFTLVPGIDSPGLLRLWSFSECTGSSAMDMVSKSTLNSLTLAGKWQLGQWGCGYQLLYPPNIISANLSPALSGSNFSLAFRFKGNDDYSHPYVRLENTTENIALQLDIFGWMMEFHGFPGLQGRYDCPAYMNNTWHQAVLVWNAAAGYWSLFVDGQELFYQAFSGLSPDFNRFTAGAISGTNALDDVALWNRALTTAEIHAYAEANKPFNPQVTREAIPALSLLHSWKFDEISGSIAHDEVGGINWTLPSGSIVYNGLTGRGLNYPKGDAPYLLNVPKIKTNNYSLSWWLKNDATLPYGGRLHLDAYQGENLLSSLSLDHYRQIIATPNNDNIWVENGSVPVDNEWHHFALVYDDYRYRWQFFVDGQLKIEELRLPLPQGSEIDTFKFSSTVWDYKIDNLKIWRGALDATKVLSEYNTEK
ncbi:MAG: LamG-like jellyroll fold domain-containing protein [bacterium]|nr:LamG-like jellyroll fold domain-containing protein [bacterium]